MARSTARKTYSLPREYADWVAAEAERLGTYESSIVRLALDQFIAGVPLDESALNEGRIRAKQEMIVALERVLQELQHEG